MVERAIWDFLKEQGATDAGAAGLMGNLFAESGLYANNLQNTYNTKLELSDEIYTMMVDSGVYDNFVNDGAGYGIAQWTFWSRKADLQAYAKLVGKSIGDLEMQLAFLWHELTQIYSKVKEIICTTDSVLEASNSVLLDFERPADQSETVQVKRAGYGAEYFEKYKTISNSEPVEYLKDEVFVEKRYNTVEECPIWSQDTIQDLVSSGYLYGNGVGLDLSWDMIRMCKIMENMVKGEIVDA